MRAHRFDAISAVLALVAMVAAILVMVGSTVPFDADVGPWLAVAALGFGLILLPWGMRRPPKSTPEPDDPTTSG